MKRHALDVIAVVFACVFVGLAASWLADHHHWTSVSAVYVAPGLLIVAGLLGIGASLRRSRGGAQDR
ncbi:MAG: hypothetical protein ACRDP1_11400 [Nocardioidaceae bacterium]